MKQSVHHRSEDKVSGFNLKGLTQFTVVVGGVSGVYQWSTLKGIGGFHIKFFYILLPQSLANETIATNL